jgi:hypothetical protein
MSIKVFFVALVGAVISLYTSPGLRAQTTSVFHLNTSSGDPYPVWSGNSLLVLENHSSAAPTIHIYDKSGNEIQKITVQIPDAHLINIYGNLFARSADGFLAVSGSAYTNNNLGAVFLAVISPDGTQVVVRTSPYVPKTIVFAPDGTIWTAGRELAGGADVKENYLVIRRFDKTGKLLSSAVPMSSLPSGGLHPAIRSYIVASKDRIGWFSTIAGQYIELSLDGKELARYTHQISVAGGAALCDDNSLWVGVQKNDSQGNREWNVSTLNRDQRAWSERKQPATTYVYGCSGTTLPTTAGNYGAIKWLPAY